MTATITYETVTEALRQQAAGDLGRRPGFAAAAELLLWHDGWPRRGDFHRLATSTNGEDGTVRVAWYQAAEALANDEFSPMSSSELTILKVAVALACDQWRFNQLGNQHAAAVLRAITTALPQAPKGAAAVELDLWPIHKVADFHGVSESRAYSLVADNDVRVVSGYPAGLVKAIPRLKSGERTDLARKPSPTDQEGAKS